MQVTGLARNLGALAVLAVGAVALFLAIRAALVAVGVADMTAYATAVGAVLPPVLAVADAYTPFGNSQRTAALRQVPTAELAVDGALAAAVGAGLGFVGGRLFLAGGATSLLELVVVTTAVVVGYVTFIARNIEVYGDRNSDGVDAREFRP